MKCGKAGTQLDAKLFAFEPGKKSAKNLKDMQRSVVGQMMVLSCFVSPLAHLMEKRSFVMMVEKLDL